MCGLAVTAYGTTLRLFAKFEISSSCMPLTSGPLRDHLVSQVMKKSKIWISNIMANVEMYVYEDFGRFLARNGWENASGPLPDYIAPQPDRNLKFWLHADLDHQIIFQISHQPGPCDQIFVPLACVQNFVVDKKKFFLKKKNKVDYVLAHLWGRW